LELHRGDGGVLHLDVRVVDVGAAAIHLLDRSEKPAEQVDLMGRLVDGDATTFGGPFASPWGGGVVLGVPPLKDHHLAEHHLPDLPLIDCRSHPLR
jgi:hypothetical protein